MKHSFLRKKLKTRSKSRSKKQATKEKASSEIRYNYPNNTSFDTWKPVCHSIKSWAAVQIAPKSSIGLALNKVRKGQSCTWPLSPLLPSVFSQSMKASSSSSEDDKSKELLSKNNDPDSHSDGGLRKHNNWCHGSKKHLKRHCSQSSPDGKEPSIKPILPRDYNKLPEPRFHHCFVWESNAYVWDGKVY